MDPNLSDTPLGERVALTIPPAQLFSTEVHIYPHLSAEIRDFRNKNGAAILIRSSKLVVSQLGHGTCDGAGDKAVGIELAKELTARGRRKRIVSD